MINNFLFPRRCLGCGEEGSYFCSSCLNLIPVKSQQICPVCQKLSFGGKTHPWCVSEWGMNGLTSGFYYQGIIKKAIKKIKYRLVRDLSEELINLFLTIIGEEKEFRHFCLENQVILVPIPLHFSRLRWRGFNQAEVLGRLVAKNLGTDFLPDLLIRIKKTKPQADLDKKEREKNLRNAFVLNKKWQKEIKGKGIILFDDIWTTGATLKEATKTLKRNGARKVWGLTLAG
ncbi:MAG: ComF family protein [Microgenomates group bacterium]